MDNSHAIIEQNNKWIDKCISNIKTIKVDELKEEAKLHISNDATHKDMRDTITKLAVDKIDLDTPDWTFAAGALLLDKSITDIYETTKTIDDITLLKENFRNDYYDDRLLDNIDQFELGLILAEPMERMDYMGTLTIVTRYAFKDSIGRPIETPKLVLMRVALSLSMVEKPDERMFYVKKFYEVLSNLEVMNATPTLSNAGKKVQQLSSCFVSKAYDSVEGITNEFADYSILSKFGGGIGSSWGEVRSAAEDVRGNFEASGGKIPSMNIINSLSVAFDQLGCVSKNTWINIKYEQGGLQDIILQAKEYSFEMGKLSEEDVSIIINNVVLNNDVEPILEDLNITKKFYDMVVRTYVSKVKNTIYGYKEIPSLENYHINSKGDIIDIRSLRYMDKEDLNWSPDYDIETLFDDNDNEPNFINKKILIGDALKGSLVKSYNIESEEAEWKEIIDTLSMEVSKPDQIKITFDNYTETSLVTSKWHPTPKWTGSRFEYIRADELNIGDISVDEFDNFITVREINSNPEYNESFKDLTVEDYNNYFASADSPHNDMVLAHNSRRAAISTTVDAWDVDVVDWIDLKKNSGDERRRAHDIFPAIAIPDLFMERVNENGDWCLFKVGQTQELHHSYGDKFKSLYLRYEQDETIFREIVKAKDLWKLMLKAYFEQSGIFLMFRDTANNRNPNQHSGMIYSTNLCCEIFQNTSAGTEYVNVHLLDKELTFKSDSYIEIDDGSVGGHKTIPAKELKRGHKLLGYGYDEIMFVENIIKDDETAVCNLASVNLSRVNTKEDIARVVPIAIRMLDNVIDINYTPIKSALRHSLKYRSIGLGAMGEHEMIANKGIYYSSEEHNKLIDETYAYISYYAIDASCKLAKERGSYPAYKGSSWSEGKMTVDTLPSDTDYFQGDLDYDDLRKRLVTDGMRNGYLMAIAPTSTISILVGTTSTIEPVYKRKWMEENILGMIPVTAPKISVDNYAYYTPAFEIDMPDLARTNGIRQKYIDQGISLNFFVPLEKGSGKYLNDIYQTAFKYGCKSTYYLRTQSPEIEEEKSNDIIDRSMECSGCQ